MSRIKTILSAASMAALALYATACGADADEDAGGDAGGDDVASGSFTIGLVWSSTGPFAGGNEALRDGARYAVDQINEDGGINGVQVELPAVDLQFAPQNAVTLVPQLVTEEEVIAIVGPLDSGLCDTACTKANELEVPLITHAGRPGVLEPARPFAFSFTQPDGPNSVPALVEILESNDVSSAALLVDTVSATTVAQAEALQAAFEEAGVEVVEEATFSAGDTNYSAQASSIAASGADVVGLAAGPADAGRFAKELRSQGGEALLIGTGSLQSGGADFAASGGEAVEGSFSASQYDATNPEEPAKSLLEQAVSDNDFDEVPLNFAYGFDSVFMIKQIIEDNDIQPGDDLEATRLAIQEGLEALEDFEGMAGTTSFTDAGTSSRPALRTQMSDGRFVVQREER